MVYRPSDMFQQAMSTTPPLSMAPSTAAPGIGGGSTMPITSPLATQVQAVQAAGGTGATSQQYAAGTYAADKAGQMMGRSTINPVNIAANVQKGAYDRSLWQPGSGGKNR